MFTSAWHLNSVYPKIKQQKLQHWMQEKDLQVWVSSPAQAGFEGISFSAERAAVADPASAGTEGEAGGLSSGSHPAWPQWVSERMLSSPGLAEHQGGTGLRPNDRLEMAE